ncbi:MAG: HEAT repeat domain-containing protein [Planctomycetota bacterium]
MPRPLGKPMRHGLLCALLAILVMAPASASADDEAPAGHEQDALPFSWFVLIAQPALGAPPIIDGRPIEAWMADGTGSDAAKRQRAVGVLRTRGADALPWIWLYRWWPAATSPEATQQLLLACLPDNPDALQALVGDARDAVRAAGIVGVAHRDGRDAVPLLIERLQDDSHFVRMEAADALGHLVVADAAPALRARLGDASAAVRWSAFCALLACSPSGRAEATSLLADVDQRGRFDAHAGASDLVTRGRQLAAVLPLLDAESPMIRTWAAKAVATPGMAQAAPSELLARHLDDREGRVVAYLLWALAAYEELPETVLQALRTVVERGQRIPATEAALLLVEQGERGPGLVQRLTAALAEAPPAPETWPTRSLAGPRALPPGMPEYRNRIPVARSVAGGPAVAWDAFLGRLPTAERIEAALVQHGGAVLHALAAAWKDASRPVRMRLVRVAALVEDPQAEVLHVALANDDAYLRSQAAQALVLAGSHDPAALGVVAEELLDDHRPYVGGSGWLDWEDAERKEAISALASSGDVGVRILTSAVEQRMPLDEPFTTSVASEPFLDLVRAFGPAARPLAPYVLRAGIYGFEEKLERALLAIGEAARPAIKAALASGDEDVREAGAWGQRVLERAAGR